MIRSIVYERPESLSLGCQAPFLGISHEMSKSLPEIIDNHFLYRYCDSPGQHSSYWNYACSSDVLTYYVVAYESPSRAGQKMGRSGCESLEDPRVC